MAVVYTEDSLSRLTVNQNVTTANVLMPSNSSSDVTHEGTMLAAKWTLGLIIILGLVTNTLILIILTRSKIGSQTTRIILIFLAATDLLVMVVELFLHYIPMHWQWFPIFYTNLSCGFANMVQASIITTSAWYIMLMTIERFTVVYFPMRAKIICTNRKILAACILIPIVSVLCFSHLITAMKVVPEDNGYMMCRPNEKQNGYKFKSKILMWTVLYFFIPATTIVVLNTAIVIRLAQAHKLQRSMTKSVRNTKVRTNTGLGRVLSRSRSASSSSSSSQSIRKATTLVIAASVTFVLLMIPRGVSTTISLDVKWDYSSRALFILDHISYLLQYLNHAINFFLYVLANNNFRREMQKMCQCSRRKPQFHGHKSHSYLDTDVTQMTYVRPLNASPMMQALRYHDFGGAEDSAELCNSTELVPNT